MIKKNIPKSFNNFMKPIEANNFLEKMEKPNVLRVIKEEHTRILENLDSKNQRNIGYEEKEIPTKSFFCGLWNCFPTTSTADVDDTSINNDQYYYINGFENEKKFLCCVNPNEQTIDSFLKTVWDKKIQIIVTFSTSLFDTTYFAYWRFRKNYEAKYNEFKIETINIDVKFLYALTTLRITYRNILVREVLHFCYFSWPENNLNCNIGSFIKFMLEVNLVNKNIFALKSVNKNYKHSPVLIHCNDGFNRSAAFCLLDISISIFEKFKIVCLPRIVKQFQKQRKDCLNNKNIYIFCHYVLYEYISNNKLFNKVNVVCN
uniref:Putative tyrosine phosphatase protein n=1 Tax=Toxoneuron nigriceps polydnavirus TaxID=191766 RepID=Q5W3K8_9VIRU|nr:putative tyrosine phosphatase protein [Toxoneuron nigriceps polydnavirus]